MLKSTKKLLEGAAQGVYNAASDLFLSGNAENPVGAPKAPVVPAATVVRHVEETSDSEIENNVPVSVPAAKPAAKPAADPEVSDPFEEFQAVLQAKDQEIQQLTEQNKKLSVEVKATKAKAQSQAQSEQSVKHFQAQVEAKDKEILMLKSDLHSAESKLNKVCINHNRLVEKMDQKKDASSADSKAKDEMIKQYRQEIALKQKEIDTLKIYIDEVEADREELRSRVKALQITLEKSDERSVNERSINEAPSKLSNKLVFRSVGEVDSDDEEDDDAPSKSSNKQVFRSVGEVDSDDEEDDDEPTGVQSSTVKADMFDSYTKKSLEFVEEPTLDSELTEKIRRKMDYFIFRHKLKSCEYEIVGNVVSVQIDKKEFLTCFTSIPCFQWCTEYIDKVLQRKDERLAFHIDAELFRKIY